MKLILCILFLTFLYVVQADDSDYCESSKKEYALYSKRKTELSRQIASLEKQFESHASTDFAEKSNRITNTLSQNRAKKAFFAKKRLEQRQKKNDAQLAENLEGYCRKCDPESNDKLCER